MPAFTGAPQKVFISVDERTGRSTVSFWPADVGTPFQIEDDRKGDSALVEARSIASRYPGCTVDGPHFHTSKEGARRPRRRQQGGQPG